jgi:hypothetical protein
MTGGPSIFQWIGIALAIATILFIFMGKLKFLGENSGFFYGFAIFFAIFAIVVGTIK